MQVELTCLGNAQQCTFVPLGGKAPFAPHTTTRSPPVLSSTPADKRLTANDKYVSGWLRSFSPETSLGCTVAL